MLAFKQTTTSVDFFFFLVLKNFYFVCAFLVPVSQRLSAPSDIVVSCSVVLGHSYEPLCSAGH